MTSLSRRPDHVAAGRAFLLTTLERTEPDLPTYGEFAATYGGIARAAASVLNSIARDCAERGEPDLSVLVVTAGARLPGLVDGQPVSADDPASLRRWREELARVRSYPWPDAQPDSYRSGGR